MTNETRKKILIADDDEMMLGLALELTQENFPDFQFESFASGTSLEKRLNSGVDDIRLIVTDNDMPPGLLGSEIINKYAKKPEFSDIRFVLCYGGDDEVGKRAVNDGAFAFIKKPYMVDDYCNVLRNALNHSG